jgi:hypothetical protein
MAFKDEREAIIGVLEFTGKLLERLISRLNIEDRARFADAWFNETKPQLVEAVNTLRGLPREEDIRRRAYEMYEMRGRDEGGDEEDWARAEVELSDDLKSEDGPLRSSLRRVGLVGKSLKLKLHYLAKHASGGWRWSVLNLLNKFLGSLAGGLPGVEPVKEFKEWLEGLLEGQPEPDESVRAVYNEGGYDPFRQEAL